MNQGTGIVATILLHISTVTIIAQQMPTLICVCIVDQLRQDTIEAVRPFLRGGLKKMLDHGTVYTNAFMPHAMPSTAPGHTALATGTWPKYHGIIGNNWSNAQGDAFKCDEDDRPEAAVFSPTGMYPYGKSAKNLLVDSIAESMLHNLEGAKVYALSLKSRSAIFPAGKAGKAIWFDADAGRFTSSKAYYQQLPAWLASWNKEAQKASSKLTLWDLSYPKNHPAYGMTGSMNYAYAGYPTLIHTKISDLHRRERDEEYELFLRMPQAHTLLLSSAQELLKNEWSDKNKPFLLWLGLSSFDKIGHMYGPRSLEYIDLLYKLDKQLEIFMTWVAQQTSPHNIMFVLTSDHGGAEIPEILQAAGYPAHRINSRELIQKVNAHIQKLHNINAIATRIRMFSLYLDEQKLQKLSSDQQQKVCEDIQACLRAQPGIRDALTREELESRCFSPEDRDYWYQQQYHHERSGRIILQVLPYAYISPHANGTGHRTPYDYDTHIPLVLYRPGQKSSTIATRVYTPQLTSTMADVFGAPAPSATSFTKLPTH